jgi:hypothetical protein
MAICPVDKATTAARRSGSGRRRRPPNRSYRDEITTSQPKPTREMRKARRRKGLSHGSKSLLKAFGNTAGNAHLVKRAPGQRVAIEISKPCRELQSSGRKEEAEAPGGR